MSDFNAAIVDEFRANGGKVAQFGDAPLVVLNTIGAKSGEIREVPLVSLVDGDQRFVFASAAGSPKSPDWYHNIIANPEIDVEVGTETFRARLSPLDDPARADRLAQQIELMPQFGEYVTSAAPRLIPVIAIERI
ncbi:MAG: nitroreductase family deazaflavin-dependent oxidoreductase [Acidimicrobiia bacterium]|nr:nitroreductase family deazaflavin-dependent oxidoreductase [Acidimicrobiia bacterium]